MILWRYATVRTIIPGAQNSSPDRSSRLYCIFSTYRLMLGKRTSPTSKVDLRSVPDPGQIQHICGTSYIQARYRPGTYIAYMHATPTGPSHTPNSTRSFLYFLLESPASWNQKTDKQPNCRQSSKAMRLNCSLLREMTSMFAGYLLQ